MRPFSAENAREDWAAFLKLCPQTPQLVWVGLGAPKQERWMREVAKVAPETLFFGIGAAMDFLSESKARAPGWMQRNGLEWFFRLVQEPRRLGMRYLATNSRFLIKALVSLCSPSSRAP
jgi:N-acetylglucosaminyldiphosphoundecaprenol N-acetyl-beta-D-mannosaminyltransferase